jgi:hypothetical protein
LHAGLSWDFFDAKQEAMRALFGIAELQSMMASAIQATRRSGVSSSWAIATVVGSAPKSKPTTASTPMRILIMMISRWRERRASDFDRRPMTPHPVTVESCDGHHIFSLFAHTERAGAPIPPRRFPPPWSTRCP